MRLSHRDEIFQNFRVYPPRILSPSQDPLLLVSPLRARILNDDVDLPGRRHHRHRLHQLVVSRPLPLPLGIGIGGGPEQARPLPLPRFRLGAAAPPGDHKVRQSPLGEGGIEQRERSEEG